MGQKFNSLPKKNITIDAANVKGPFEWWRNAVGHGGINSLRLPERVVEGIGKLKPRLLRTFIQEYFNVYPEHGRFDWSLLDPYMDSLAATGAKVVAAITIKPPVLYPEVDQNIWMPNNVEEWQKLIYELVKRYSVDKPIVSYWEIGNETDIGEWGGCPYLIKDPEDYGKYYSMTIKPILEAFPQAKVGGPAIANVDDPLMPGFIKYCADTGTQLDFVSWHLYSDDPELHKVKVLKVKELIKDFPGKIPEMLVTEMSKGFDPLSIEELAFEPERAAIIASSLISMMEAGLDWSFYYHIWDQTFYIEPFKPFYKDPYIMIKHWNEIPHRFGLFVVSGEVRPQYFVYQMLSRMGNESLEASSDDPDMRFLAARDEKQVSAFIVNRNPADPHDKIVNLKFTNLNPSRKLLKTYRIDSHHRWSPETLELNPVEQREVDTLSDFPCQVYSPADSVMLITLTDIQ